MGKLNLGTRSLLPMLLLAGCASTGSADPEVRPAPAAFSTAGLGPVMGRNAAQLQAQFGTPDLDIREGTARKLQFASPVCVLDAYLYPPERGQEPVVTYIDARLPDGRDMDRASCVAAMSRRN